MSIFEKLGIKNLNKIPVDHIKASDRADYTAVDYELLRQKEIGYREMLEALIISRNFLDNCCSEFGTQKAIDDIDKAIEKATGKTWEEIEELIK